MPEVDSGSGFNTMNPLGTFGAGYDVGSYSHSPDASAVMDTSSNKTGTSDNSSSSSLAVGLGELDPPAPLPVVDFSFKLKAFNRVDFTNNSLNGVSYRWQFGYLGGGASIGASTQENPIFYYPHAGTGITRTYTVTLRVYNKDGEYVEITKEVEVKLVVPVADFEYSVSGTLVKFENTSTNIDSDETRWSFGDGESSEADSPYHTYSGNGTYTVTLNSGAFSRTQIITIDAEIALSCDEVATADGYKWERSPDGSSDWVEIDDTELPALGVTEAVHNVDATTLNYFRVKAYNAAGDSDPSEVVSVQCL